MNWAFFLTDSWPTYVNLVSIAVTNTVCSAKKQLIIFLFWLKNQPEMVDIVQQAFRQDHMLDRNLSLILITLVLYLTCSLITHVIVNKVLDRTHRRLGVMVDDLWLIRMFISIGHRWRYNIERPPVPSWPLTQKSRPLSNSWPSANHCGWQRAFSFTVSYCKLLCSISRYV